LTCEQIIQLGTSRAVCWRLSLFLKFPIGLNFVVCVRKKTETVSRLFSHQLNHSGKRRKKKSTAAAPTVSVSFFFTSELNFFFQSL
jgi:hypothetical protein